MGSIIDFKNHRTAKRLKSFEALPDQERWVHIMQDLLAAITHAEHVRRVQLEVSAGEFEGHKGYFLRYIQRDKDILIRFVKSSMRSQLRSCLSPEGHKERVPWKNIDGGEAWQTEGELAPYFLARVESGYLKGCIYWDFQSLDRKAFNDV